MTAKNPLRIGVFIPAGAQLLDLSSIDLFAMLRPEYLAACKLPAPLVSLGVPSTIHYISMPSTGSHMQLTASAFIRVSKTTEDPEVQPGMLDILLIPGPDPSVVFEEEVLGFLRRHAEWKGEGGRMTDILGVCTSCYLMAQSGILKGHTTCGPRALIPELRKRFPDSKWIDDKRWTKGGNIWNSGKPICFIFVETSN
jgi:transcriptional regulator GlxA family with amidase domain